MKRRGGRADASQVTAGGVGWLRVIGRMLGIVWVAGAEWLRWRWSTGAAEEHVRRAVLRLGPTFIKLGQVASTRPDLVPPRISAHLESLQEQVPPFPFDEARATIERELGRPLEESFHAFPREPVAAASLSQVYLAELRPGERVAVKVRRPGLRRRVEQDLAALRALARVAEWLSRTARTLRLRVAVEAFGEWTLRELDFEVEGRNAEEFRRNFADEPDVVIPAIHWSHTTEAVLTMEEVSGVRLRDVPARFGAERAERLARRLAEVEMKMFIVDAFFHADLHPGNVFFREDGTIAILDLGMVGRMREEHRDRFLAYWIAVTRRQRDRAFHHLVHMAKGTDQADLQRFRDDYDVLLDRFYDRPLSERSLASTYLGIVVAGARRGVAFPPEMILQAKAVVTAESLNLVLAPGFRFSEEVRPILARELGRRAGPRAMLDRLWSGLPEWLLLGETAPGGEVRSRNLPEEQKFRDLAVAAVAEAWADELDGELRILEGRAAQYASSEYWAERPEARRAFRTAFALLRMMEGGRVHLSSGASRGGEADPGASWPTALHEWAEQADRPEYWADRPHAPAQIRSLAVLGRFLAVRTEAAVREARGNGATAEPSALTGAGREEN